MAVYNLARSELYIEMFTNVVRGRDEDDAEMQDAHANLLIDIRFADVAKAFAHVLYDEALRGEVRPLARTFERMADQAALTAFGTRNHEEIPSWFFQNFECLLASALHKLLLYFRDPLTWRLNTEKRGCAVVAFNALIGVAEGLRSYVGLDYLRESTGVHVLMSAVQNAKCDFLKEVVHPVPRCASLIFAEVVAQHVLAEPNRELVVQSGFCFFARSQRWRAFASACMTLAPACMPGAPLARLLREVDEAKRSVVAAPPGLFFLASEFLEADASPERAHNVSRSANLRAGPDLRSPIAKRSKPFLRLVKRLVSGSP